MVDDNSSEWQARLEALKTRAGDARQTWIRHRERDAESNIPSRPIFVEFSGTPKSGKSSSIETVRHFFRRNDFKTLAPAEGASRRTPAFLKDDLLAFNIWSGCYSLTHLLERANEESPFDLVLLDRGLFDVNCWLRLLEARDELTREAREIFQRFFLFDDWRSKTDIVALFTVDPEIALSREHANNLSLEHGRAMNPAFLTELNQLYHTMADELGTEFTHFIRLDTSSGQQTQREISYQISEAIIDHIQSAHSL